MKIIVCTKVVLSYEDVLPDDWKLWGRDELDLRYVKRIYGCFDEAALETALRLRQQLEAAGQTVTLEAVSIAGEAAAETQLLAQLYAVGFDRVVQIGSSAEGDKTQIGSGGVRHDPKQTAALLSGYIKSQKDVALVLCGDRADPGNWGQTGIRLAYRLGLPCFCGVAEVSYDGHFQIVRKMDRITHTVTAAPPLVLTIGNTTAAMLRLPTLRQKLLAKERSVEKLDLQRIEPDLQISRLSVDKPEKKCRFIKGADVMEKARTIRKLMKEGGGRDV